MTEQRLVLVEALSALAARAPWEDRVVVVTPEVCRPGAAVWGVRRREADGMEVWRFGGGEGDVGEGERVEARCVCDAAGAASALEDGVVGVVPGEPLRAWLDGRPCRVVVDDRGRYRDRVRALPGAEVIAGRRAVVVGLGSVGSDVGARLARLGVEVLGFDPDVLEVENAVRWGLAVDLARHVGRPKAAVFVETLRAVVPEARVEAWRMDVEREARAFGRVLEAQRPELIVVATDTWGSRVAVNAAARRLGLPALYVSLSDGAASARIELVEGAGQGPCHLCAMLAEGSAPVRRGLLPYEGDEGGEGEAQVAVAALPVDVGLASAMAARVALVVLAGQDWRPWFQHGQQRGTVAFFALRPDWWVFDDPWTRLVYAPVRHAECPLCAAGAGHDGAGGEGEGGA